ncbi:hypothetical protein FACS189459_1760 [Bacilli bacterium]|nr:hypothetical protein FACS189459_1760 [Bacilli bacterium]
MLLENSIFIFPLFLQKQITLHFIFELGELFVVILIFLLELLDSTYIKTLAPLVTIMLVLMLELLSENI